ncbi:MAG: hypothetical protein RPR40_13665 [Bermanella sp.]
MSAYSNNKASKAQAKGIRQGAAAEERIAAKNLAFQKEQAEIQREDFAPWREAGEEALGQIQAGIERGDFSMDGFVFEQDLGYQFRMNEGVKALDNSASARGRLLSGAQQKGVNAYAQNVASQEYSNAYNRESNEKSRKYNILSSLNQGGQSSAAGQAQVSSQLATSSGNIMAQQGRSQNVAAQNIGNSRASAYQGQAQIVNQAAQNWLTYDMSKT